MSGRSISSAVEPVKRTSPFSMNTARRATVSAMFTDCSTRMIVAPWSAMARTITSSCSTTAGASPSDSSSIMSSLGRDRNAWARVSICCSPPERFPAASPSRWCKTGK